MPQVRFRGALILPIPGGPDIWDIYRSVLGRVQRTRVLFPNFVLRWPDFHSVPEFLSRNRYDRNTRRSIWVLLSTISVLHPYLAAAEYNFWKTNRQKIPYATQRWISRSRRVVGRKKKGFSSFASGCMFDWLVCDTNHPVFGFSCCWNSFFCCSSFMSPITLCSCCLFCLFFVLSLVSFLLAYICVCFVSQLFHLHLVLSLLCNIPSIIYLSCLRY